MGHPLIFPQCNIDLPVQGSKFQLLGLFFISYLLSYMGMFH